MRFSVRSCDNGFTLVELLIVVSIIIVMSSFLIPGFTNYIDSQNIIQAKETLKSDLRTVQNRALTGESSSDPNVEYWGIRFPSDNATQYNTFKSLENTATACNNATSTKTSEILPGGTVVRDAGGACVFFSIRNGDANVVNKANNTFGLGYSGDSPCQGVEVNSAGLIRGVNLCP